MPQLPEPLARVLAFPGELLRRYEEQIVVWSETTWFPKLVLAAHLIVIAFILLSVGFVVIVGWAAGFFIFAIPVAVCLPPLIALHRRQRREGSYSRELQKLELQASTNDAKACFELGQRYLHGKHDTPRDPNISVKWFRKGSELGHAEAMAELGEALAWGHGVHRNAAEALGWLEKAAALGHAKAAARAEEVRETLRQRSPTQNP